MVYDKDFKSFYKNGQKREFHTQPLSGDLKKQPTTLKALHTTQHNTTQHNTHKHHGGCWLIAHTHTHTHTPRRVLIDCAHTHAHIQTPWRVLNDCAHRQTSVPSLLTIRRAVGEDSTCVKQQSLRACVLKLLWTFVNSSCLSLRAVWHKNTQCRVAMVVIYRPIEGGSV